MSGKETEKNFLFFIYCRAIVYSCIQHRLCVIQSVSRIVVQYCFSNMWFVSFVKMMEDIIQHFDVHLLFHCRKVNKSFRSRSSPVVVHCR